ncbi:MAG: hypothetical protein A3F78_10355 [Burkholderiales bacterium RIFCSPLOWO2_12_FULL_61_40]|nr:MAG: hypothetical protein A3F78_10355 [Burkholderiales bacterium RIFCSPLOWO2_12_FULL_61_40]
MTSSDQAPKSDVFVQPPEGYATWLDYAVATMDFRSAEFESLIVAVNSPGKSAVTRSAMRQAVLMELDDLRRVAGVLDTFPASQRET